MHGGGTGNEGVEVVDLEPKKDAVAVGFPVAIPDGDVVVMDIEGMKLEDQLAIGGKAFVFIPAVGTLAAEELLVPEAAGLDAGDSDERMGAHTG